MSDDFDAVVVGAGLGGLTAAARLAAEGLTVLVLESDPHPGGTAYSYERKGFLFPMGPLGFSSPDLVRDIIQKVGITSGLETRRVHYELRAFGMRVPLSRPYHEMIEGLSKLFPAEEASISRFFGHVRNMARLQYRLAREGAASLRRAEAVDAKDYLDGLIEDWRLKRILGSMGSREPYSDMALLSAMWSLLCDKGIHYPSVGMRGLCDLLAGVLGWEPKLPITGDPSRCRNRAQREEDAVGTPSSGKANPASILALGTRVSRITVERGRATGVILSDGTRVSAKAVISNADFKSTFLGLLPRESVPDGLYHAVRSARQTHSNLQVCLGVDASLADLSAFREASRVIHRRHRDGVPFTDSGPDWETPMIDPSSLAGEELEAALLSADDPRVAPPGHAVLVLRTAASYRHFARFRTDRGRRARGYFAYKTSLARALVEEAEGFVPGLARAVTYTDVATPLTFEERGGRSEGAVAGWSWEREAREGRMAIELVCTPVAGLYMAGYQAFSMLALGGVPSAMLSGLKAAEYLMASADPVSEMSISR